MFDFLKNFLQKKTQPDGRRDISGNLLPPPPGPEASLTFLDGRKPAPHEMAWAYPKNYKFVADPDGGKKLLKNGKPDGIVIHHTATYDLGNTVDFFTKNEVDVHFVIGKTGAVVQMVPCNKDAAHAGESEWNGMKWLNNYFIGIEVVNLGPLKEKGDGYVDAYGRPYVGPVRERKALGEQYWQPFTEEQEKALYELCLWLVVEYGIKPENVIAHYEAAPTRKIDPAGGMADWPMDKFRDRLR